MRDSTLPTSYCTDRSTLQELSVASALWVSAQALDNKAECNKSHSETPSHSGSVRGFLSLKEARGSTQVRQALSV